MAGCRAAFFHVRRAVGLTSTWGFQVPLKAIITGAPPEGFEDYYKPMEGHDDTFVLDVEPGKIKREDGKEGVLTLEDTTGLKTVLSETRSTLEKTRERVKAFDDLDPKEVREKLAKLEELQALDPTKEADKIVQEKIEALKKQLTEKHQQDLESERQKSEKYRSRVYDREIRAAAVEAIAAEKGVPELLLPHVQQNTRLRETDEGNFLVEVVDAQGNVRIGDSKGTPMTIAQLVAEMKSSPVFGRAFEGSGSTGSGSQGNDGGPNSAGSKRASEMSVSEKTTFISKHGIEKWTEKVQSGA